MRRVTRFPSASRRRSATLVLAALVAVGAMQRSHVGGAADIELPALSEHERLEQAGGLAAGGRELGCPHQRHRPAAAVASRLRLVSRLRDPVQRGRLHHAAQDGGLRLRRRIGSRALPDPCQPKVGGWQRPTPADVGHPGLPPLRAVQRPQDVRRLARRLRRDLGPELERAAPERLDERRCRRPANPAGTRSPRRGDGGRDPSRHPLHRAPDPQRAHLPGAPPCRGRPLRVPAADGPAGPPQGSTSTSAASARACRSSCGR